MSEWRSRLTAGEDEALSRIEAAIQGARLDLKLLRREQKAIANRAIQRNITARKRKAKRCLDTQSTA